MPTYSNSISRELDYFRQRKADAPDSHWNPDNLERWVHAVGARRFESKAWPEKLEERIRGLGVKDEQGTFHNFVLDHYRLVKTVNGLVGIAQPYVNSESWNTQEVLFEQLARLRGVHMRVSAELSWHRCGPDLPLHTVLVEFWIEGLPYRDLPGTYWEVQPTFVQKGGVR